MSEPMESQGRDAGASPDAEPSLRLTRRLDAPRERVYRAWADPAELARWFVPEGFSVPDCEIDLRPGGAWRVGMRSPAGSEHRVGGVYREVRPPERLVFTWVWEGEDHAGGDMLVSVEFREQAGGTELILTHRGFTGAESRDDHEGGWSGSLVCLAVYLEEAGAP